MENSVVTMANEPMIARPMTSYNDVMSYLHTIHISPEDKRKVAKRLTEEVMGKNLSRVFERIDYLASLPADWDGYGALPVSRQVILIIKKVLLISDDEDWKYWMISPAPNGTLGMQSKRHIASISVGEEEYSFYSCNDGREDWGDHVEFTPERLLETMRQIV